MEQKSKSLSKSPILRLAFKSLLVSVAVFAFRQYGGEALLLGLLALFGALYFVPFIENGKLNLPTLMFFGMFLLTPRLGGVEAEVLASLLFGSVFGIILGIKNIIFINRQAAYYFVHIFLILLSAFLFFTYNKWGIIWSALFFASLTILFRAYYTITSRMTEDKALAYGAVIGLLGVEVAWAASMLPVTLIAKSILVGSSIFLVSDTISHYLKGEKVKEAIATNIAFLGVLIALISIFFVLPL